MRIVILGANGQLGRALTQLWPEAAALDRDGLDITDRHAVAAFNWADYDVVINAAAYTNVDGAETTEGALAASRINASGPVLLAKAALDHDLTIVHVSSDYVFDGTIAPHKETEPLTPMSVYGRTKADGDRAVAKAPKHYIVRTSWVVGDGANFVRTMAMLAERGVEPKVVADQIGRLTFTTTLARGIAHLLEVQAPYGTYNLSNIGPATSWAEITRRIYDALGKGNLAIPSVTTAEYFADKPNAAKRPLQSMLSLDKIQTTGFDPPDWRDELKTYLAEQA